MYIYIYTYICIYPHQLLSDPSIQPLGGVRCLPWTLQDGEWRSGLWFHHQRPTSRARDKSRASKIQLGWWWTEICQTKPVLVGSENRITFRVLYIPRWLFGIANPSTVVKKEDFANVWPQSFVEDLHPFLTWWYFSFIAFVVKFFGLEICWSWKLLNSPSNCQRGVHPRKWTASLPLKKKQRKPQKETRIALKNHHFSGVFAVRFEGVVFFCSEMFKSSGFHFMKHNDVKRWRLIVFTDWCIYTRIKTHIREMKRKTGSCNLTRMKNLDGSYWWYFVSW